MFGKRKQDHKHRFAEDAGDSPDGDARPELDDPELAEALLQLGRNRHSPLRDLQPDAASEPDGPSEPDAPTEPLDHDEPDERDVRDESDVPVRPAWGAVPTAAMLAEPEPEPEPEREAGHEPVEPEPTSMGEVRRPYGALPRMRVKGANHDADAPTAKDESASRNAELKTLQTAGSATDAAGLQAAIARADELEQSLRESQARIEELTSELDRARSESPEAADGASEASELKADLELARSEAAAAGVALERVEREANHQAEAVAAAEERAERLAAEVEQLRAAAATEPAQVERLHREAERERTLHTAMEQAQKSHEQAEAALADNLRLASELAANLRSQEGLITALTGLQAEITEQRAWFEAQIASAGETEGQQTKVIESLQAAIQDRDIELDVLRRHLLEAEAKRAEEAAAFVAALERP
jgi:hypothetical protein